MLCHIMVYYITLCSILFVVSVWLSYFRVFHVCLFLLGFFLYFVRSFLLCLSLAISLLISAFLPSFPFFHYFCLLVFLSFCQYFFASFCLSVFLSVCRSSFFSFSLAFFFLAFFISVFLSFFLSLSLSLRGEGSGQRSGPFPARFAHLHLMAGWQLHPRALSGGWLGLYAGAPLHYVPRQRLCITRCHSLAKGSPKKVTTKDSPAASRVQVLQGTKVGPPIGCI